ncbi:acyltransferase [Mesorhizobium sp. CA18]|uniref:acyltransferase family protein n=1 Tax=unclassified Mesorhizobium TaxID=325217 RepID=UPI001CCA1FDC|nr:MULTISPECIES: acyltransferase [unclassified Mesorhizobium]MBZ9734669.1 acyltransferase [Mesorhizobium sp. CA9]MBZ9827716.1 acyltransferase [Mesorhizobium sp. CA18]MBZ9833592.1 acyltransferase [Mesorhizobium sp. CA2]MBZ9839789.1 acyltransferase [Mesorhizobium sp. CA3]MBZ9877489.1 acyltransferase [Mesorhizobium sp. Ca11]
MKPKPSSAGSSLTQLTSLRFFAALYVLAFHSADIDGAPPPIANFVQNGYLGVSFFFLLSGFILTHSYFDKMSDWYEVRQFALARFSRIYPIYLLALIVALPLTSMPLDHPLASVATLGLVQAWGAPTTMLGFFWNPPGWTLSIEFFFYLVFPLLLPVLSRLTTGVLWISLAALVLIFVVMCLPGLGPTGYLAFGWMKLVPLPLLRLPEFMTGIICALLFRAGAFDRFRSDRAAILAMAFTVATLVATRMVTTGGFAAIGFVALIATCAVNDGKTQRVLSYKPLVLLGNASYALYILQIPVRKWIPVLFTGEWDWVGSLLYQPLLVVISVVVFILVEEPARKHLRSSIPQRASPSVA